MGWVVYLGSGFFSCPVVIYPTTKLCIFYEFNTMFLMFYLQMKVFK
ncbi:hypothetical protein AwWohl_09140 [Gammaproteobacteria bacterium]|nr:hypothetical protein AwWohl_09140 [Gammaproteobacteria bacterium]